MHALGTDIRIEGEGAAAAAREIRRLEGLLTRFRPSALTRLNRDGHLEHPPHELVEALQHALEVAERSGGLVTPTVLPSLEHAGYLRSWPQTTPPRSGEPPPVEFAGEIEVTDAAIRLPKGVRIDLGGTAKSWIVERAAQRMRGDLIIDAGGDVLIARSLMSPVEIAHPFDAEPLQVIVPAGRWGVATSSLLKRAWPGAHHLIDPRTARPALSPWVQTTATCRSLTQAEVVTKLALLGARGDHDEPVIAFDRQGRAWLRQRAEWTLHGTDDPLILA